MGTRFNGDAWYVWYNALAYGYLGIGVTIGGFVIGILTVQKRIWALKVNFFFQAITIGVILSSVYYYGWGLEYNFGLNPRNSMLILSSVILVLVILTHRESVQEHLSRIAEKHKYRLVIIPAIILIIAFWTGWFDFALSYSHITYGTMPNPLDENEELYVIVRHTSPTLAANTPAFIEVGINMNYTYRQSHNLTANDNQPDSFWLIFNDSDCGVPIDLQED